MFVRTHSAVSPVWVIRVKGLRVKLFPCCHTCMLLSPTSSGSLTKQVHEKTFMGKEGVLPTWRNWVKQLHSPGMRNWKGKLCSPGVRVPVKQKALSASRTDTDNDIHSQCVHTYHMYTLSTHRRAQWGAVPAGLTYFPSGMEFLRPAGFVVQRQLSQ